MNLLRTVSYLFLALPLSISLLAEGPASTSSNISGALNPKISVISDFVGRSGTGGDPSQAEDGFHVREVEIGIRADVDPYARADFFIGGMNDRGAAPELEEGYVTFPALPWWFQARGGKFRANFGRLNTVHPHELPQTDSPLVLDAFLGEERLTSAGVEVSRLFAPFGFYTEASYALLQDLGDAKEQETVTTTVLDAEGNPVPVAVVQEDEVPAQRLRNFAQVAKVRFYSDLTDTTNLDVGLSGALHEPKDVVGEGGTVTHDFDRKRLGALDLTFRWKPLAKGGYRSSLWRTEGFYTDQSLAPGIDPVDGSVEAGSARIHRRGAYSYLEVQPAKRWRAGVRGDYVEDPKVRDSDVPHITRALAPYVTFTLSEFNRFRLQWTHKSLPGKETENLGFFQWTVVLGPHGAHAF